MNEIRKKTMNQFMEFSIKELSGINDIQLLILKGHIIVEYTMNFYLESISKSDNSDFFKENFTFAEKVKIAKHFGQLGSKEDNLILELTLLNKLRNNIAHSLKYDERHLLELFAAVDKKSPNLIYSDKDKQLIHKFAAATSFISGAIFSAYKMHVDRKDVDEFIDGKK